jgi:hypothetical protein
MFSELAPAYQDANKRLPLSHYRCRVSDHNYLHRNALHEHSPRADNSTLSDDHARPDECLSGYPGPISNDNFTDDEWKTGLPEIMRCGA